MIKIDKHISLLDFSGFNFPHCNCLWIEDDKNCLIDTSPSKTDLAFLKEKPVDLIINSHGHIDHYLFNHYFPDSKILMHREDHAMTQSADNYLEELAFKAFAIDPEFCRQYLEMIQYRNTRIDGDIKDGQIIDLGSTTIKVLHLPGHSPGHCGFLFPEQGFVFTADIELSSFGPWYAGLHCSIAELLQSLDRLLDIKPEYIITGHGEGIVKENVSRHLKEYRDIIYARQRRIVDLLFSGHHTLEGIASKYPIYRKLPNPVQLFYLHERTMVMLHLQHLRELGYVIQEDNRFYLKEGLRPSKMVI